VVGAATRTLRALSIVPIVALLLLTLDAWRVTTQQDAADACDGGVAIVLGAAQYDGTPSPAFERRLAVAASAYAEGCIERIIVTGGGQEGDRTSEGESGAAWLARQGVPAGAVTAETTSRNTVENLRNAQALLENPNVVIVTDDLHAYRAGWIADRLGMTASQLVADTPPPWFGYALRETLAMQRYRWFGLP